MLNIFTDKSLIPKGKYVLDNEAYFVYTGINESDAVKRVLAAIDGVTVCDKVLVDRFGYKIYPEMLSTGAKTLVNILSSDDVFDIREIGYNALLYLYDNIDGSVYVNADTLADIPEDFEKGRFSVNGKVVSNEKEFCDYL